MNSNRLFLSLACAGLFIFNFGCAYSQEQTESSDSLSAIKIIAKKNPGDVSYKGFLNLQKRLIAYLPPEPRMINYYNRLSFTGLTEVEADDFSAKKLECFYRW